MLTARHLRSTGLFDGAAAGEHIAVLAAWAIAGLACLLLAARLRTRTPVRYRDAVLA